MARAPSILYMIDNLLFGGAQRDLGQLATAFRDRGYRQEVICLNRADPEMLAIFQHLDVPVTRWSPARVLAGPALWQTVARLRRGRHDAMVSILPVSETIGRLAARIARTPLNMSLVLQHKEFWQLAANRLAAPGLDVAVINTERLRAFTERHERIPPDRIHCIPNGADLHATRPADRAPVRKAWGLSADDLAVGCVGRLSPEKGQDLLLRAFTRLAPDHPRLHLFLAGEGPLRSRLETLRDASPGPARVHLLGNRNDVPRLLAGLDAYVQPSRHEGMPNALLEAMCAGLPCVVTNAGGMPDVVADGESGVVVPPESPADLASALGGLLGDAPRRQAMGRAAGERARDQFSLDAMIDRYDHLIRDALAAKGFPKE